MIRLDEGSLARWSRRRFLHAASLAGIGGALVSAEGQAQTEETVTLPFENGERQLIRYPQKRPLIRLTTRPPQLETPFSVFAEDVITPNDAFFVRYHLAVIPTEIDPEKFRLTVQGQVSTPLELSLGDLRSRFEAVEIVAVNQCSGNSRGFSQPRVPGGQMGHGAMGNARWKGARLKDVLDRAGIKPGARQVTLDGLDCSLLPATPDFVKAIDLDQALDGEILLAYEMNGADLPMLNGYPLRVVVPGHYGTYWIKHLSQITVIDETFNGYWMNPAYRIPDNSCACVEPGTAPKKSVPITRFNVRSFITNPGENATLKKGVATNVKGIAFDGGYGIRQVLFSADNGKSWREAELLRDLGRYSFREWQIPFTPDRSGIVELKAMAVNRTGQTQPMEPLWNPAGYMRNVVETVRINAA